MKSLGIVGAGLSALSCGSQLISQSANMEIRLFEKSKGIGGRAATRKIDDYVFDHGANYLSMDSLNETQLVNLKQLLDRVDEKKERVLIQCNDPLYILNHDDTYTSSERESEKTTFPQGINYLGKLINGHNQSRSDKYTVQRETFISHLEQIKDESGNLKWRMFSNEKEIFTSDVVLMCPPAPQLFVIIQKSIFLPEFQHKQQEILDILIKSEYNQITTVSLGFKYNIESPKELPFYALLNLDKKNDVGWLSLEHKKPGHIAPEKSMIIVQMSPDWSAKNWDSTKEEMISYVQKKVEAILSLQNPIYDVIDVQKWKFALPRVKISAEHLKQFESLGLFFSGDSFYDRGRIGVALVNGIETAESILKHSKL